MEVPKLCSWKIYQSVLDLKTLTQRSGSKDKLNLLLISRWSSSTSFNWSATGSTEAWIRRPENGTEFSESWWTRLRSPACLKTLITQWLKHFLSVVKKPTHQNYFWLNDTLAKLRMVSKYDLSICIKSNAPSPPKNIILSDELELLLLKIDWVFRL